MQCDTPKIRSIITHTQKTWGAVTTDHPKGRTVSHFLAIQKS